MLLTKRSTGYYKINIKRHWWNKKKYSSCGSDISIRYESLNVRSHLESVTYYIEELKALSVFVTRCSIWFFTKNTPSTQANRLWQLYLLFFSATAEFAFLTIIVLVGFLTLLSTSDKLIFIGSGFSVTSITTLSATEAQSTSFASFPREIPRSSSLSTILNVWKMSTFQT